MKATLSDADAIFLLNELAILKREILKSLQAFENAIDLLRSKEAE